ncbi:MAG: alanine racemase [Rickettsiales bacterium]|jgi:alanine racemase|nr:alanine racemase [Rickettsiales bacterium]
MGNTTIEINLGFVRDNYLFFRKLTGHGKNCFPVVKANAYGLGILEVVEALLQIEEPQRDFFVYSLRSALDIRLNFGSRVSNIYVLRGPLAGQEEIFAEYSIIPAINSLEQLKIWSNYARSSGKRLTTVLQFNLGINRSGIEIDLARYFQDFISFKENGIDLAMIMGHLGCQHPLDSPLGQRYTIRELDNFRKVTAFFPGIKRNLVESRGAIYLPKARYEGSRIGIGLFTFEKEKNTEIKTVLSIKCDLQRDRRSGKLFINFGTENGLSEDYENGGFVYVGDKKVYVKRVQDRKTLLDPGNESLTSSTALLVGHMGKNHIDGYEFSRMNGTIPEELFALILTKNRNKEDVMIDFIGNRFASTGLEKPSDPRLLENLAEFDQNGRLVKLTSTISEKRTVREDGFCGYDATEPVKMGDSLVTISLGYLDGFSRKLSGTKVKMFIKNASRRIFPCILCGRVSMDQICARIDRKAFEEVEIGDKVLIIDDSIALGDKKLRAALNTSLLMV